jgi:sugar phosphate isomerase/epimerase
MIKTAKAAKRLGVGVVNGFTGSSIWPLLYAFPPVSGAMIDAGFKDFGRRWKPILDEFQKAGVKFALEVHPTEIAFDIVSAERAIEAVDGHPAFGFNYDPSHLGYQGVDYVAFIERFHDRIFHVHMKDVAWRQTPGPSGVFGGHLTFGDARRFWDFRSLGRGNVDFERIIRALNVIGYSGPLSVEWEDSGMDREHGAREACEFVKRLDFAPSGVAFDAAFEKK